jgi:hypothetical protein
MEGMPQPRVGDEGVAEVSGFGEPLIQEEGL